MSGESFTVSNNSSWGSRLGGAIMGVLIAPIALLGASAFLFWNEGNVVHTAQSLDEGERQVVSIVPDKIDPAHEGKLVYATGETKVAGEVTDQKLGIAAPAIKLKRVVEMYQWEETKKKKKKTTTYTYNQKWLTGVENSRNFHRSGHENPGYMPLHSSEFVAGTVTFGAFSLNEKQIAATDTASNQQPRTITAEEFAAMPEEIRRDAEHRETELYLPISRWFPNAPQGQVNPKFEVRAQEDGDDSPMIGDIRIKYVVVNPGPTTIVAQQAGNGFVPFNTKAGKAVHLFRTQKYASHEMFELARADNTMWAWIFRGIGVAVIFAGFMFLMGPLTALTDWVPVLGSLVSGGVLLVAGIGTLFVGSLVISFAWLFYRPVLAICIVTVAVLLIGGLWFLFRRKAQPLMHSSGLEVVG